ncbi:MAG: hypothetical protein JWQ07_4753 [Ramlibacter sp.]|nr:hypothetical protein [Ramlibacter sp.]
MMTQGAARPTEHPFDQARDSRASGRLSERVNALDWWAIEAILNADGFAVTPQILSTEECERMISLYRHEERFRSRIVMERYAFGRGEYKYFSYPLPDAVQEIRTASYAKLAPIANRWHAAMHMSERFPPTHEAFTNICHQAGQTRPTPLMLKYGPQDYCCLHQDLYGDQVFPFQMVFLLSRPGEDFEGGELLLTESDSKRPGRADVVPLSQGQAVIVAVNSRPKASERGFYRVNLRHGVSRLHSGSRHTLGIIFHDGK